MTERAFKVKLESVEEADHNNKDRNDEEDI